MRACSPTDSSKSEQEFVKSGLGGVPAQAEADRAGGLAPAATVRPGGTVQARTARDAVPAVKLEGQAIRVAPGRDGAHHRHAFDPRFGTEHAHIKLK